MVLVPTRLARHPISFIFVFMSCASLGLLSLARAPLNASTSAVWLPSGFAFAAILILGRHVWPAVFLGSLFSEFAATQQALPSLAIGLGSAAEALIATELVGRFAAGREVFHSSKTIFRFVVIAGIATAASASCGLAAVSLAGELAWTNSVSVWITWWMSGLTGNLVIAPFVLLWMNSSVLRVRWQQLLEGAGLLGLFVLVCLLVFGGLFPSDVKNYPLEFLCVPFFLWGAFRFGRREMSTVMLVLAAIAAWGTLRGYGPFQRDTRNESLLLLQAYTAVMAIMSMVIAATVADQKQAETQLHELALTDPLTGLANYRRLLEVLRSEIGRSNRNRRAFAVLFLDMNGLKKINDRHGHLVGSRALCRVADCLRQTCRVTDTLARFGGDEFAIVLPETDGEDGKVVLQRLYDRLALDTTEPLLSVSGGVAVFPEDGESPTMLLRAADRALYEAKMRDAHGGAPTPQGRRDWDTSEKSF